MTSTKRVRSVVHSIAHHATSGLCYMHPHLGQVRKRLGVKEATVNLLRPDGKRVEATVGDDGRRISFRRRRV